MYARLMEVLVKELSSGASTIQSSMSAYTGGTTQFLGGVAQFESSVEQMKISSMITVMEKITELGIQAAQEKGSSSIIGYSRIFHQAYYGQSKASLAVEQSILSSISMWKEFLALLTASMKIEGSFAAGTHTSPRRSPKSTKARPCPGRYNVYETMPSRRRKYLTEFRLAVDSREKAAKLR